MKNEISRDVDETKIMLANDECNYLLFALEYFLNPCNFFLSAKFINVFVAGCNPRNEKHENSVLGYVR